MKTTTKGLLIGTVVLASISFAVAEQSNSMSEHTQTMHQKHMMTLGKANSDTPVGQMGLGMFGGKMGARMPMGQMGSGMHKGNMGSGMSMMNMMGPQVPDINPITPEKTALGKQLYFDPRLSKDGTVSCNSCHDLAKSGADNKSVSIGVGGLKGVRNAPTVWNSSFHQAQFWDGRASSLEEQIKGPLLNPVEMAMPNAEAVVAQVKSVPGYVKQFENVFGNDSVNIDTITQAIATFERTLVNNNSKFDKYRFENKDVLSQQEKKGFQSFTQVGCMQCHMGPDLAGPPPLARNQGFFEKFPKFEDKALINKYNFSEDKGLFQVTNLTEDSYLFRVSSLRNVKDTAPYFHNGQVKTLDEAVKVCAKLENNRDLSDVEVKNISAFLGTLSGVFKRQTAPKLPL